jgi:hypothetical protein
VGVVTPLAESLGIPFVVNGFVENLRVPARRGLFHVDRIADQQRIARTK